MNKKHVDRISVAKMRIFRWITGKKRNIGLEMKILEIIAPTEDKIR